MKSLFAFIKKEFTYQLRSGKLTLLGIMFLLFGIMNPAVAKLTPWLLEVMADTLSESGMTVTAVTVTALDSWVQFYKNMPMALIIFVLAESSIFTNEYQSGTLILSLTKGLQRYKPVIAKTTVLYSLWTAGYWLCFAVTYGYNAYFWDNSITSNLTFSVICWWLFGLWVISLTVLFSVLFSSNSSVLTATAGSVLGVYLAGLFPKINKFLPTLLTDGNSLIFAKADIGAYTDALVVTVITSLIFLAVSIPLFNRKTL